MGDQFFWNARQLALGGLAGLRLAWHTCSLATCYALNTKFLTGPNGSRAGLRLQPRSALQHRIQEGNRRHAVRFPQGCDALMRYAAQGAVVALVNVISFKDKVRWIAHQTNPVLTMATPNGV